MPFPHNHQFKHEIDTFKSGGRTSEGTTKASEAEADEESNSVFGSLFEGLQQQAAFAPAPVAATVLGEASPHVGQTAAEKKAEDEALETAKKVAEESMKNMRRAHGEWDRKRREYSGTVEQSKVNSNTKGSVIECLLTKIIEEGDAIDNKMLQTEIIHRRQILSGQDREQLIKQCETVFSLIKDGNKKSIALKSGFDC